MKPLVILWERARPRIGPARHSRIIRGLNNDNRRHPIRIEPGIPCRDAREQSSELMGYVRELTITGLMDEKPMMIWAAHYLSAMAKALMDDVELG
ncbi:DUF3077 domain-containing protein [Pseudomonas asiatica]|uniref:DUF3077 domain-containing protein n=1 Tax=Pseudomonas asiatica TaxID=2219225 RepID=UPI00383A3AAC